MGEEKQEKPQHFDFSFIWGDFLAAKDEKNTRKTGILQTADNPCGAFLSCFGKKGSKEADSGAALTVKSFDTSAYIVSFYPDFKPPAPKDPTRPQTKDLLWSKS